MGPTTEVHGVIYIKLLYINKNCCGKTSGLLTLCLWSAKKAKMGKVHCKKGKKNWKIKEK